MDATSSTVSATAPTAVPDGPSLSPFARIAAIFGNPAGLRDRELVFARAPAFVLDHLGAGLAARDLEGHPSRARRPGSTGRSSAAAAGGAHLAARCDRSFQPLVPGRGDPGRRRSVGCTAQVGYGSDGGDLRGGGRFDGGHGGLVHSWVVILRNL